MLFFLRRLLVEFISRLKEIIKCRFLLKRTFLKAKNE